MTCDPSDGAIGFEAPRQEGGVDPIWVSSWSAEMVLRSTSFWCGFERASANWVDHGGALGHAVRLVSEEVRRAKIADRLLGTHRAHPVAKPRRKQKGDHRQSCAIMAVPKVTIAS